MKVNFDIKKGIDTVSTAIDKTAEFGKHAASDVKNSLIALSEKSKQDGYLRRLKKYNPLFWEVYNSSTFAIPNMIVIVDDAVRRGIDVCEGAMGWLSNQGGMEVLHLYDEAVGSSGLQFVPSADCDAVYYVDSFCRNRFIRIDCIFSTAHEERLAELKHVAHALGAKKCTIEITESSKEVNVQHGKVGISGKLNASAKASSGESAEQSASYKDSSTRSGHIVANFEGNDSPKKPKLKWFTHDPNIKRLIEMRCKRDNSIQSETLQISGASTATMSKKTAYSIDCSISKLGVKGNSVMESQVIKENQTTLIFHIEF